MSVTEYNKTFSILSKLPGLIGSSEPTQWLLTCPVCNNEYVHIGTIDHYDSPEDISINYHDFFIRGRINVTKFWCEQGHNFKILFGTHKGNTYVACRRLSDDKELG